MAAAATKTLKVGTGVCLVAQRDPIQTAKLVASIDTVSGGRFLFGIGNGWNQDEMENHGTPFKERHKMAREKVEAMKAIWTKSKPEYHGGFVSFDPMMTWPKPAGHIRRLSSAFPYRPARDPLWRRLDSAGLAAHIRNCRHDPVPQDGDRGRPRSGVDRDPCGSQAGRRPDEALPGPRYLPRGVQR
jgi:hypothetical protein